MKVLGISGSVKQPSRTSRVVSDIIAAIEKRADITADTIDLAVAAPILFRALRSDQLDEEGRKIIDAVEAADVLIVGSPVYRASYTGALKHLFDLVDFRALQGKRVVLVATGGTPLHGLMLEHQFRPLFGFFGAVTVPTTVYAVEADFTEYTLSNPAVEARIDRAVAELIDLLPAAALAVGDHHPALRVVSREAAAPLTFEERSLSMTEHRADLVKFAYWVPNVSGGLVISNIEQRTSWTIDYNRKLAQIAEANGFDYALSQIRFTAGYGAEFQHESVSFSHALLESTTTLKVIAAILPGPWNPALAAKQIATINHLTNGRVAVNVVSGWFRGEFHAIGEPWLDHDERYRRSEEFIRALRGIWTEENFTFRGDFYRFNNYSLKPKPIDPQPEIFQGGSSRAARDMAARVSDWYFTNGNTPEEIAKQVNDIRAKAKENNHSVKVGVNAFAIVRETEEEAKAVLAEIIEKANPEAVNAFGHEVKNAGKSSPEGEGNWAKSSFEDLVQYNDGFRSNLIGTPRQVAERVVNLKRAGADLILLGFLHFQEEVEYFGKHVIPLVRELEEAKAGAAIAAE